MRRKCQGNFFRGQARCPFFSYVTITPTERQNLDVTGRSSVGCSLGYGGPDLQFTACSRYQRRPGGERRELFLSVLERARQE